MPQPARAVPERQEQDVHQSLASAQVSVPRRHHHAAGAVGPRVRCLHLAGTRLDWRCKPTF